MRKGKSYQAGFLGILILSLYAIYLIFQIGCAPQQQVQKEISPERQKAIEDSIRKAKELEIARYWSFGYEYYKNKNYKEAKPYFWKVINMDPNMELADKYHYKDIFARLANCYIQENKADSAQLAFEMGVKHFPNDIYLHESLGYMYRQKGMFEDAIQHYKKAVELDPEKAINYKHLADLYIRTNQPELAIEALESYVKMSPEDRDAQEKLAVLYRTTGREDEAIRKKEEILAKNPDDTGLMFDLGKAYYNRGESEKAVEMLNRLLQKEPENVEALQYLAGAYMNLERYDSAIATYKKILKIQPENIEILCAVAGAYRMKNQFVQARNYVRRALRIDPKHGLPYMTMGEIYESAAEYCMNKRGGKLEYDDKLVYEKAYKEYQKATRDPLFADRARRRMEAIKPLLPTTEDRFFNKYNQPKDACYKWIS
jgi:tetratricopeptide (TPR) repeat protein